jgi:histidyl-tRNA synthetase
MTKAQKIAAPRGTEDILPPHSARWSALEERMRALATRFGYGEIRTPTFESTDLFVRGVGEATDIVQKEMYTFTDRGGRSLTLRPEWTAPVVRAVLEHNLLAHGPQRLFYIGSIFRYERPQKGRLREAHQFGVECFGYAQPEADAEVIALADALLREMGVRDVTLRLNSVGDARCRPRYREALIAHFRTNAARLSDDSRRRLEVNPLRILDSKDPADRALIASAPRQDAFLCESCRAHVTQVRAALEASGVAYELDPLLVRGLDYYTRTVFEFTAGSLGAQNAVCGGGRYDDLVAQLGGPPTPAVGFALGIERLLMVLEAQESVNAHAPLGAGRRGIQVIPLGERARSAALPLVAELRRRLHAPVFVDYADRKLLAHFKLADRNRARHALILGDDELEAGELVLRDLEDRTERRLPLDSGKDVAAMLAEITA